MRCLAAGLTLFSPPPSRPPIHLPHFNHSSFQLILSNFKFSTLLVYLEKLYIMVRVCRSLSIAPPNPCSLFSSSHTAIVTVMAVIRATTTEVAATVAAGAVTGMVMLSAVASAISTGVSRSRFPSRKIFMSKTSASVLALTAK